MATSTIIFLVISIILAILGISLAIPSELGFIDVSGYYRIAFWLAFVVFLVVSLFLVKISL